MQQTAKSDIVTYLYVNLKGLKDFCLNGQKSLNKHIANRMLDCKWDLIVRVYFADEFQS